jgi:hypothetical protein
MKTRHKIAVFSALVILSATVAFKTHAGFVDSMLNADLPEVEPTAAYEIDTYGYDSRVYEWTPAHNPDISCVFVASNKSSGVGCYPTAK